MAARLVVHSRAIVVDLDSIQKWSLTVARVLICELGTHPRVSGPWQESPVAPIGEVTRVLVARPAEVGFV
jgi:hypothetical protein